MGLAASEALVKAGQGQEEVAAHRYAPPCSWCRSDILWRSTLGDTWMWNGSYWSFLGSVGNDWQIQGVGDFDGNGLDDILWRGRYGDNVIWSGGNAPGFSIPWENGNWLVQGVGDFDRNGQSDILWRCKPGSAPKCGTTTAGTVAIWAFSNGNYGWPIRPGVLDFNWEIHGVGDFDANGESDILWRCLPKSPATACGDAQDGSTAIWNFSNGLYGWTTWLPYVLNRNWKIQGVGHFDWY